MLGYSMTIPGGFKSIIADTPAFYGFALAVVLSVRLPEEPRGLYEVRVAISGAAKEVESLEEFDFMDEVKDSVRVIVLSDA